MQKPIVKIFLLTFFMLTFFSCERPTDITNNDDGIPPAVPAGLRVYYASDGEVVIEWQHNSERDLKEYHIYRRIDTLQLIKIASTQRDYFVDDSLSYEETYFYSITAIDYSGKESQPTYEVSATPINRYNPARPGFPQINARNWEGRKSIFISWEKGVDTDIAGYLVYRSVDPTFTTDSISYVDISPVTYYNDTSNSLNLNTSYYYRIKAVDRGNLISEQSDLVSDEIFDSPLMIYPPDNSTIEYFTNFKIFALTHPASYKIILQENQYFGEVWSKEFNSDIVNDTINILFDYPYARANVRYYWRMVTFSNNNPNSISLLKNFELVQ
jgi:hypothetical protein